MSKWAKRTLQVVSAIALLAGLIFGVNAYETKFATAEDIKSIRQDIELIGERLENKIQEDRLHALQSRIWKLEDRYGGPGVPKAPDEIREHYREMQFEFDAAKRKIIKTGG